MQENQEDNTILDTPKESSNEKKDQITPTPPKKDKGTTTPSLTPNEIKTKFPSEITPASQPPENPTNVPDITGPETVPAEYQPVKQEPQES